MTQNFVREFPTPPTRGRRGAPVADLDPGAPHTEIGIALLCLAIFAATYSLACIYGILQ